MSASPSVDWVVSLGSILGIVATFCVVGAAAWRIIAVIRKKVTENVVANRVEAREMFAKVESHIQKNEETIQELIENKVMNGKQRYDEMRYWMERIQTQVEKNSEEVERNRNEIYKRIEVNEKRYENLLEKISELQTDVTRLVAAGRTPTEN